MFEEFAPNVEEFVGDRYLLERLEKCIKEGSPVLLHGSPGVGKTTAVYAVARKLGFKVIETNASDERKKEDLENLLRRVKTKTLRPVVYLLDEVDGIKNYGFLIEIIDERKHPVVLTANEVWQLPDKVVDRCVKIEFKVNLTDSVRRVKTLMDKFGLKGLNLSKVTGDVRSSILASFYGGDKYESLSPFEVTRKIFEGKPVNLEEHGFRELIYWLVDNVHRFYWGKKLFDAIQVLCYFDKTGRTELLKCLPKGRGKVVYPFYFRRVKALWGGNEK